MNPFEFDDWLLHTYLYPLDNFVVAAPRRGPGWLSCITAAKSEYGLQSSVLHNPGKVTLFGLWSIAAKYAAMAGRSWSPSMCPI